MKKYTTEKEINDLVDKLNASEEKPLIVIWQKSTNGQFEGLHYENSSWWGSPQIRYINVKCGRSVMKFAINDIKELWVC